MPTKVSFTLFPGYLCYGLVLDPRQPEKNSLFPITTRCKYLVPFIPDLMISLKLYKVKFRVWVV